jgi:D-psicose/D-tagatose/L-ribulose 3-epimerase
MSKYGAWCLLWGPTFDKRYLYLIDRVKNLGFDALEIPLATQVLTNFPTRELKGRLTDTGMRATFCAGLEPRQNVASKNRKNRARGIDYLKRCVEFTADFGNDFLAGILYGVWGGFTGNPPTEDELNWSADSIREVADHARTVNVDLAVEPCCRFECYLLATVEEGLRYIKRVGRNNIGLLLDTFQMNIEEKNLPSAILTAGDKLVHFHVCASDRGIPGNGHIDWKGVFESLKKIGYNRWMTVESFWPEPGGGTGAAAKVWRQLAPSPDDIAKGGLELIKKYMG